MSTRLQHTVVALVCFCACAAAGCKPTELIHNPEVQRWCGERPCQWEVKGQVHRVGTWNADDYAVELASSNAELYQTNETAEAGDFPCIHFTMLAKVDPSRPVFVELDFNADGSAEWSKRLPAGDYVPVDLLITPPTWFHGVTFRVRKDGPGTAIIAKLRAQVEGECTDPPLPLRNRPDGAPCDTRQDCASNACTDNLCGSCGALCGSCEQPAPSCECPDGSVSCTCADAGSTSALCPCFNRDGGLSLCECSDSGAPGSVGCSGRDAGR